MGFLKNLFMKAALLGGGVAAATLTYEHFFGAIHETGWVRGLIVGAFCGIASVIFTFPKTKTARP